MAITQSVTKLIFCVKTESENHAFIVTSISPRALLDDIITNQHIGKLLCIEKTEQNL